MPELLGTENRVDMLTDYLKANDKLYWVRETSIVEAVAKAPLPTTSNEILELSGKVCEWWGKHTATKPRNPTDKLDLDQAGWDRITMILAKHEDTINEQGATFEFCLKLLLLEKCQVNERLLLDCSAFHRLTGKRFKGMKAREVSE